ncbi:MAG: transposase [Sphingobacterium sp.]
MTSELKVTTLYRLRWQIEVLFKWVKQNRLIRSL